MMKNVETHWAETQAERKKASAQAIVSLLHAALGTRYLRSGATKTVRLAR
jgi:hypothetical protein